MSARIRVLSALSILTAAGTAFGIDVTRPFDFLVESSTNFPAAESGPNAIDNTARTKYLNFDEINTGFDVTPTGTGVVHYITIITANDAPPRDPTSFTLQGSDDGVSFTDIASGALTPAIDRFSISSSDRFENETSYSIYRVIFPTVRDSGGANSMQVAEVQLATKVDITSPDDPVSITLPDGAMTGPGEGVNSLFDNKLGTKLDVQVAGAGPTTVDITPLAGSTVVSGLSFFSANDDAVFTGRTPSNITVFGSNDGVQFNQIFTTAGGLLPATDNFQDQEFDFENSTAYAQYRIVFDPPFGGGDLQVGDLELFGTANSMAPANDNCNNATPISAGTTSGTTALASGTDITACGDGDAIDVWYSYTAAATGLVEFNTCDSATDTTLAVYSSCGGAALACDDNGCGAQSLIQLNVTSGSTYLIRVALLNSQTGSFRLTVNENPEVHDDVALALPYNFNGMVHDGEAGMPDNPDGYRSISDRGLIISNDADSIGYGTLLGLTGIHYSLVTQPGALDIVHLGDRNTTDNGNHVFDDIPDGDNIGIQPNWLPNTDQTGPQTVDLSSQNIVFTADTRVGILYQVSNGGGFFNWTLNFENGSAVLLCEAPDWFFDQSPGAPGFGVENQAQLGVFRGAENEDLASTGASLNVVEAITSTSRLSLDGFGDFTGQRLLSITFSDRTNTIAGYAFLAATVRDAEPTGPACACDFNNDTVLNSQDFFDFLNAFFMNQPSADFNHDDTVNSQDFFDFLNAFFAGC
jgi:hypothetical protein